MRFVGGSSGGGGGALFFYLLTRQAGRRIGRPVDSSVQAAGPKQELIQVLYSRMRDDENQKKRSARRRRGRTTMTNTRHTISVVVCI
jgi:hypothetical protein